MKRKRLGVNIDHVATVRNARGENYPDPLRAAIIAQKNGANSITIHLREDRRHIHDEDLKIIKKKLRIPVNLEIAPTREMLRIAVRYKPKYVCIVPEKRSEITTEGGLNLKKNIPFLKKMINKIKKNNIRVSLFINPNLSDVKIAKNLNADCIEIHTGRYCNSFTIKKKRKSEFNKILKTANFAKKNYLEVHAGHGLTYETTHNISKIDSISEFNIGHFIISESIFIGLSESIRKFKKIINN